MTDASTLATVGRCSLLAPAGCGKTHMIAEAATRHNTGKELVLTHTHAGVSALKQKVEKFSKSKNNVQIETIASWVLRYAKSFPKSSNFHKQLPENNHEWNQVYLSVAELLKNSSIKEIVKSSYTGVYVDEYQDCTVQQHETIMNLSEIIPCRILGDPIQSIFGFGANTVVNWDKDVAPFFTCLPELTVPWRWKDCAPELGEWLTYIRKQLIDRNTIDLSLAPKSCVRWVELPDKNSPIPVQIKTCFDTMKYLTGNIAAIYGPTDVNPCNFLARRTGGKYSVVEVIDCSDLFESACKIMNSSGLNRLLCIINFAKSCMSGLSGDFENVVSAFQKGKISTSKKYEVQVTALKNVIYDDSLSSVLNALEKLRCGPNVDIYRKELYSEMKRALLETIRNSQCSLEESAKSVRYSTQHIGRILPRFAIGRTLILKGLEFDHVIVLNADKLAINDLYVAFTRPQKTLTVLSKQHLIM